MVEDAQNLVTGNAFAVRDFVFIIIIAFGRV